jgi:hypothetical protein
MNNKENTEVFTINQDPDCPDLWVVESIKSPDGTDRTDGRYPGRIGCTVVILLTGIGKFLVWSYVADSDGGFRCGVRRSGLLLDNYYDPVSETLYAESLNSRYILKKLPQKWGEIYADRSISLPNRYPDHFGATPCTVPCNKADITR